MTDRDHFAAAALAGLLSRNHAVSEADHCYAAFRWADAMLRQRAKQPEAPDARKPRGVPEAWATAYAVTRACEIANLDAAPAAKASVESVAPQPTTRGDSDRTDNPAPRPSEGTGDKSDRPQPIKDCESDRSRPIAHTPATHATPAKCSTPREGTSEPVAWWLRGTEYDTGCEYEYVSLLQENAEAAAAEGGTVTPLYRSPTLTDAEREAVEAAARIIDSYEDEMDGFPSGAAATLRGLLERMK